MNRSRTLPEAVPFRARCGEPPSNGSTGRRIRAVVTGYLLASMALWAPAAAEILDRVVATVNNETITLSELEEQMEIYKERFQQVHQGSLAGWDRKAIERKALEDLIDKSLIEAYAKKMGIVATEEDVDRAIQDVLARTHITDAELREALKNDGISYEEYREQIREQIIKAKMIQQEIRNRIKVEEEQIESYYLDHPEEFQTERGVVLRHILFPLPQDAPPQQVDAAQREAERVRQEILDGMSFEEAARRYSGDGTAAKGGWLGFFRAGALSPELERAVESLQVGEVSKPIRTGLGIHLIKLEERTSGELRPLEKVRETIREKLFEEAAEREFERWRKELRRNAYIEIFL